MGGGGYERVWFHNPVENTVVKDSCYYITNKFLKHICLFIRSAINSVF